MAECGERLTPRQRKQEEARLQARCFQRCWNEYPETRRLLFHVENEAPHGNVIEGARRKALGLVAGVADLLLLMPRGKWHGLCIEMKTLSRSSRQRTEQREWQMLVESQGYRYEVIRTEEDFFALIREYLALPH
jgi:VRR-NUC domain.